MTPKPLSAKELLRYNRQIMIPAVGEDGQKRLGKAKIFIAGLGGLGSVSAYYLAAAGVGYLKIIDRDHVGLENLNRQILHNTIDIGRPKSESAHDKLTALNPQCRIDAVTTEIQEDNVGELVEGCHIIVDATDNLETRRCLNAASVTRRTPFIYGGVDGFTGMATSFLPGETPCLECLFPDCVPKGEKIAAIGPVPGIIGAIQALEALKICLGMPGLLKNKLLHVDGAQMRFKTLALERDPACRCCSTIANGNAYE